MEDGMSICIYCANTRADKCTWFNPVKQVMPEGCEFTTKETSFAVLHTITKCPNFAEDAGGSDVRADMCSPLIKQLNAINERDYISYFATIEREYKRRTKRVAVEYCEQLLQELIEIERLYRRGFFGLFSDEDAQVMIDKLRSKARAKIEQRKRGRGRV